jgi:hypothetical protein
MLQSIRYSDRCLAVPFPLLVVHSFVSAYRQMDFSSLPRHPNGFDDPSDHWSRSSISSDQKALLAMFGALMTVPLFVSGILVICSVLWWIWWATEQIIAPVLRLIE